MGYFGFSYYDENQRQAEGAPDREPEDRQVRRRRPWRRRRATPTSRSSRPLFIYAKGSSFKRKEVQAFFDYIFDNEKAIAMRADFVPLTAAQLKRAQANYRLALVAASKS